jgi:hypothetical protein
LILLYLQSEALRTSSREVRLGRSLRDWSGRMDIVPAGKNITAVREQAERISQGNLFCETARLSDGFFTQLQKHPVPLGDLLNTLAAITGKRGGFRSLADTWADTTTSHGRLMLTVLDGLAEFERDLIRTRTGDGRAAPPRTICPSLSYYIYEQMNILARRRAYGSRSCVVSHCHLRR